MFLDNPKVSKVMFFPRKFPIFRDLEENIDLLKFNINSDILIGGYFFLNNINDPTILLFHGDGEHAYSYLLFAPLFFKCDVNLAVIDYRGYGFSTGEPTYRTLIEDSIPIFNELVTWLEKKGYSNKLFVEGKSLGSVCASVIGAHNPDNLHGVIFDGAFATVNYLAEKFSQIKELKINKDEIKKYSNDTNSKLFKKPVLVLHGSKDTYISPDEAKALFESIPKEIEKKIVFIEGADHNDTIFLENEYYTHIREFCCKYR